MENLETVTQMPTQGISQKGKNTVVHMQCFYGMEVNAEDLWKSEIDYAETSFSGTSGSIRKAVSKHFSVFSFQASLHCLEGLLFTLD